MIITTKLKAMIGKLRARVARVEKVVSGEQQSSPALTFKLNQRIGTGDPLTCDDTGFTCDNTHLTCDRTEY
jgi:hypothetical protein